MMLRVYLIDRLYKLRRVTVRLEARPKDKGVSVRGGIGTRRMVTREI